MKKFNYDVVTCSPEDAKRVDFILAAALCKVIKSDIKFDYSGKPDVGGSSVFDLTKFDREDAYGYEMVTKMITDFIKYFMSSEELSKFCKQLVSFMRESSMSSAEYNIYKALLQHEKVEELYNFFYTALIVMIKDSDIKIEERGDLASRILENATKPVEFKPFKNVAEYGNVIYVVDDITEFEYSDDSYYDEENHRIVGKYSGFYFEPMGTLDFWNEIEGWFVTNSKVHKVKVSDSARELGAEIPVLYDSITDEEIRGLIYPVGDWFVDSDYNLYRCYGFVNKTNGTPLKVDEMFHSEI